MGQLAQIFRTLNSNPTNMARQHLPMINSLTSGYSSYLTEYGQIRKKRALMAWFKGIPELTALSTKVAKDVVYRWHFEPVNSKDSGRNKILQATNFAENVKLRSIMLSQAIDMMVTGEAFGWLGKIRDEVVRKELNLTLKKYDIELKEKSAMFDRIYAKMKQAEGKANVYDEDVLRPRKYRYMASSSTEVVYNQYDIMHYNQNVGLTQEKFMPEEVVHYTLLDVDGKVNGFTPVEAVIVQLELLRQMWQNMLSIHRNGGMPDKIISLENVQPNSPAYERIKEQLIKYKLVENRHGALLFTGKIQVEDLQQLDKMQFMDSGLYITGLVAMQWEIPRSSIPYIISQSKTDEGVGSNAERGYWRNVEVMQRAFMDDMNSQLWMPYFGVRLVFDNTFLQQDLQIYTAKMSKLNNLMTENQLLAGIGKQLADEVLLKELERTDEDVKELDMTNPMMANSAFGMGTQAQQSPNKVNDSSNQSATRDTRKAEQEQSAAKKGSKPTGVGKEKEEKEDCQDVNKNTFAMIYREEMGKNALPPRIFMEENANGIITLKFKSPTDFVYETTVSKEDLSPESIWMMNLGGKIYRV